MTLSMNIFMHMQISCIAILARQHFIIIKKSRQNDSKNASFRPEMFMNVSYYFAVVVSSLNIANVRAKRKCGE